MRIPSDFKDYYDKLLYLFQDEVNPVYVRKSSDVFHPFPENIKLPLNLHSLIYGGTPKIRESRIIIFCGKAYPCFLIDEEDKQHWVYSEEDIVDAEIRYNRSLRRKFYRDTEAAIRNKWREVYAQLDNHNWTDVNIKQKSPVVMYYRYDHTPWENWHTSGKPNMIVNPCLKDYDFIKMVDPYTAIQELHMFLDNQLVEVKEPPQIMDDKIIAAAKGFGHKYAFKTEPSKPKKRRIRRVVKKKS